MNRNARWIRIFTMTEEGISVYLSGAIIVLLVLGMVTEILLRWLINVSILGLAELTEMIVVVLTFSGLAIVQRANGHISMDILSKKVAGRKLGKVVDATVLILSFGLFVFVTYCLASHTMNSFKHGYVTTNIFIVKWPFYLFATIGAVMALARIFLQIVERVIQRPGNAHPGEK